MMRFLEDEKIWEPCGRKGLASFLFGHQDSEVKAVGCKTLNPINPKHPKPYTLNPQPKAL